MVKNNVIIHPIAPPCGAARPAKLKAGCMPCGWSMCPILPDILCKNSKMQAIDKLGA